MKNILLLGATSGIAQALATRYAQQGKHLFLVARDAEKLDIMKDDLLLRGATDVQCFPLDFNDTGRHAEVLAEVHKITGHIDVAIVTYGTLADQQACQADFKTAGQELHTNFISVVSLLTLLANDFEQRQMGSIVVLSSVAGDRGRQSNYVYGAAKGGLTIFLQGLRNRLFKSGVQVLTVKPGFTDTPMTAHLKKNFLYASPDKVAADIDKAIVKGKREIYTPWFWRWIMLIIKSIPEAVFVKMKL